ncbi:hypothetical protein RRG08_044780 [Elysia crispata]|uniref:Uncharacterized protein n=1 Tax=Elysia crispata TaxID=231223 RepID=A0AAE0ZW42_9GAST|nr:hypothetical protein RRG08_044780 [Elysia crispata]
MYCGRKETGREKVSAGAAYLPSSNEPTANQRGLTGDGSEYSTRASFLLPRRWPFPGFNYCRLFLPCRSSGRTGSSHRFCFESMNETERTQRSEDGEKFLHEARKNGRLVS